LVGAAATCPTALADKIPPGSHLVDETTLDPTASDTANNWHSKVLEPEFQYTVVVSGTITQPTDTTKGPAQRSRDGLYCYGSVEADPGCGHAGGPARRDAMVLFNAGPTGRTTAYDGIDTLAGNKGQVPIAGRDHEYVARYDFTLVPGAADDYRIYASGFISYCAKCTGALHVKIYGPPASGHGTVKVTFLQRGLPKRHSEDLQRSSTSGNGTLRLVEEPPASGDDRKARFIPKNGMTLLHADEFAIDDDVAVILAVVEGTYVFQPGKGEIVHMRVEVVTSGDPECPEGRRGFINVFEPAAGRRASPAVVTNLCDHKHVFKRFKSGGTVRVKVVRHRPPTRARLL
jgi:hypothetical protein